MSLGGVSTVRSADGTRIEFEVTGSGPPLILVDGAMCTRGSGSKPELVRVLAADFTVYSYDRRGRGGSTDSSTYSVHREVADLEAIVDAAGGRSRVYGHSSGACLALEAALALGHKISHLAMYEPPYNQDPDAQAAWAGYLRALLDAVSAGRRGDAVALFMSYVGTPADQIVQLRQSPAWADLEALAPTLVYEHVHIVGPTAAVPIDRATRLPVPTLVMHGAESYPFMGDTARTLSRAIPEATLVTLDGQGHNVDPIVLAATLRGHVAASS